MKAIKCHIELREVNTLDSNQKLYLPNKLSIKAHSENSRSVLPITPVFT